MALHIQTLCVSESASSLVVAYTEEEFHSVEGASFHNYTHVPEDTDLVEDKILAVLDTDEEIYEMDDADTVEVVGENIDS